MIILYIGTPKLTFAGLQADKKAFYIFNLITQDLVTHQVIGSQFITHMRDIQISLSNKIIRKQYPVTISR